MSESGWDWPRQRMEGSRRRNPQEAGDEVGESPWGRQKRERSTVNSVGRFFVFRGVGWL